MITHFGPEPLDPGEIRLETEHFLFLMNEQPVLVGSGIIIPKRFVTTPFDLTPAEWADLQTALLRAKAHIETLHAPDGYNVGWNVGPAAGQEIDHLHLHIIPRYADEPLAGRGIRYYIKQMENKR
ncbi:MAG: HIT domain-containing protein [Caldilineaceae bacterium]|nr:HIT domain-containing protein [Caldilineaceae bacterium]